ncbi:MAG: PRC-barrel domain containing protein [Acidobacteria bacterium]|nr:MAG: PRC-barrel domain containing protein [Acidobacteriota bacterium]
MFRLVNDAKGSTVRGTDGDIGKVVDFYFDDDKWTIRYLVVDVGNWVPGNHVLISPMSIARTDWERQRIELNISRDRVQKSPSAHLVTPISRQYESEYYGYYGWPYYWEGTGVWGAEATPLGLGASMPTSARDDIERDVRRTAGTRTAAGMEDSHIRSAREVAGYHIKATDQEVGHIDDYLVDADSWTIDSIVIDTSNWPGGKAVVLPRQRIARVDWSTKQIFVNASSQDVRNSPEFTESYIGRRV